MPRIYGILRTPDDVSKINQLIRRDVQKARTQAQLSELHKRSMYLITLTYGRSLRRNPRVQAMRTRARNEFTKTARLINRRAIALGLRAGYDEIWG